MRRFIKKDPRRSIMELCFYEKSLVAGYKSKSQIARRLTENWALDNLFCLSCSESKVSAYPNNYPVADFFCGKCRAEFQLKSQKAQFGKSVDDGQYHKMIESIRNLTRPNFLFMKYDADYCVDDLFAVPRFFFTESIIQKRKPLRSSADRKGWIGCNLLLYKVPPEGKITIVDDKKEIPKRIVRDKWKKVSFMEKTSLPERRWIADVLNAVHSLKQKRFGLGDIYSFEESFAKNHPQNRHIKDKIRQQLQFLRDKGLLKFEGKGKYILVE